MSGISKKVSSMKNKALGRKQEHFKIQLTPIKISDLSDKIEKVVLVWEDKGKTKWCASTPADIQAGGGSFNGDSTISVDVKLVSDGGELLQQDMQLRIYQIFGDSFVKERAIKLGKASVDIGYYCSMAQHSVEKMVLVKFKPAGSLELQISSQWLPNFTNARRAPQETPDWASESSDVSFVSHSGNDGTTTPSPKGTGIQETAREVLGRMGEIKKADSLGQRLPTKPSDASLMSTATTLSGSTPSTRHRTDYPIFESTHELETHPSTATSEDRPQGMLAWFTWTTSARNGGNSDEQLAQARQQLLDEEDIDKLRYRAVKVLEQRQIDSDRARTAEYQLQIAKHELDKVQDVNRSLEARLQVVEQALAAVGESRVAMELAEAKVQLADQELHQMELRHVAHKERQARARADEQVTLLKEQLRKATNV